MYISNEPKNQTETRYSGNYIPYNEELVKEFKKLKRKFLIKMGIVWFIYIGLLTLIFILTSK